jgi:hypothetical protein
MGGIVFRDEVLGPAKIPGWHNAERQIRVSQVLWILGYNLPKA